MQITAEELLAEAGRMALELRIKDRIIEQLTAEDAEGSDAPAAGEAPPE
jgi:hypothetical protein